MIGVIKQNKNIHLK